MRPRMYGSSESHRFFTSTSPSRTCGTADFSRRKFSGTTHPSGRLASTMRWFSMVLTLVRTVACIEHRCGPKHAQHFGRAFELGVERDEHGAALRLEELAFKRFGGTGRLELPRDPGAAFPEGGSVVDADHAERAAQRLDLRAAPEIPQRIAARVALARELERAVGVAPAPEVVELGGAELVAQEIAAVRAQRKRHFEASGTTGIVHIRRRERRQRDRLLLDRFRLRTGLLRTADEQDYDPRFRARQSARGAGRRRRSAAGARSGGGRCDLPSALRSSPCRRAAG